MYMYMYMYMYRAGLSTFLRYVLSTANCIIIAQFPIENHFEQGQFAELPLKTIRKSEKSGDYYGIRSIVSLITMCDASDDKPLSHHDHHRQIQITSSLVIQCKLHTI